MIGRSPNNPVILGRADGHGAVANSAALKIGGVTKDTKDPFGGQILRDKQTGEPTGMLRNAYGVLKGLPSDGKITPTERRAAVKKLIGLYNAHGLTSIADRSAGRDNLDLYLSLLKDGELTIRVLRAGQEVVRRTTSAPFGNILLVYPVR